MKSLSTLDVCLHLSAINPLEVVARSARDHQLLALGAQLLININVFLASCTNCSSARTTSTHVLTDTGVQPVIIGKDLAVDLSVLPTNIQP